MLKCSINIFTRHKLVEYIIINTGGVFGTFTIFTLFTKYHLPTTRIKLCVQLKLIKNTYTHHI